MCYINSSYKHMLHSESNHLNSITDLVIELGDSLHWYIEKYYRLAELISESMTSRNKKLQQIQDIISLRQMIEENKPKEIKIQSKDLILQIKNQSEANKIHFELQVQKLEQMLQEIKYIQLN